MEQQLRQCGLDTGALQETAIGLTLSREVGSSEKEIVARRSSDSDEQIDSQRKK